MSDRIEETIESSVKGSFTLFIGNFIALVINAAGSVVVALLLSPSDYGLFAISLVIPSLFMLFTDWGVNQTLVRIIAKNRSQNQENQSYHLTFLRL